MTNLATSQMRNKPVVGLAGLPGSGKSALAAALADLGCLWIDADALAGEVLVEPEVVAAIGQRWAAAVVDGVVQRGVVAKQVFTDASARQWLEGLTHPRIQQKREALRQSAAQSCRAIVEDCPLLLEKGWAQDCNWVVFVEAPRQVRLERVAARGWDDAELARREAAQWPEVRKRAAADRIIPNPDNDPDRLQAEARRLLSELLETHDAAHGPTS